MNRTTPKLSDEVNGFGSYEIRWSELRNGVWRSLRKKHQNRGPSGSNLTFGALV